MCLIELIIAAIFALSASFYVHGDVLLQSHVDILNATIRDNEGKITHVHGRILNVQVLYVYPVDGSTEYDDIDWRVLAQSSDGQDMALYDFSMDDFTQPSSSSGSSEMDQVLEDLQTLLPFLPISSELSSTPPTSDVDQVTMVEVPSQYFDTSPSAAVGDSSPSGRTTTADKSTGKPITKYTYGSPVGTPRSRSSRVKRNAECNNPTFETPKVNDRSLQVNQDLLNTTASNKTANMSDPTSTHTGMSNSATNTPAHAMCGMKMNGTSRTRTGCDMKMGSRGTGSGNTMIPSWTAIIVPSFVIIFTVIH